MDVLVGSIMSRRVTLELTGCVVLVIAFSRGALAGGQTRPIEFAVPSGVSWYLRVRVQSDGQASDAIKAGALGVAVRALKDELTGVAFIEDFDAENREKPLSVEVRRERSYVKGLLEVVPWWKLVAEEVVLAGRLEPFGGRTWLAVCRVSAKDRDILLEGIQKTLFALSAIVPNLQLDVAKHKRVETTCLYNVESPRPLEFCIGGRDDLLLISTSRYFLRHALQLLDGEGSDLPYSLARSLGTGQKRLAERSEFFRSVINPSGEGGATGFEFHCKPASLFPDLIGSDPLLSSWDDFSAVGDFSTDGIAYACDSQFPAGQEELERVFYRSFVQPAKENDLAPLLYRETAALVPGRGTSVSGREMLGVLAGWAGWLQRGFGAVELEHSFQASREGGTLRGHGELRIKAR